MVKYIVIDPKLGYIKRSYIMRTEVAQDIRAMLTRAPMSNVQLEILLIDKYTKEVVKCALRMMLRRGEVKACRGIDRKETLYCNGHDAASANRVSRSDRTASIDIDSDEILDYLVDGDDVSLWMWRMGLSPDMGNKIRSRVCTLIAQGKLAKIEIPAECSHSANRYKKVESVPNGN